MMTYTVFDKVYESTKVNYDVAGIVNDLSDCVTDYALESAEYNITDLTRGVIKRAIAILSSLIDSLRRYVAEEKLYLVSSLEKLKQTKVMKTRALYHRVIDTDKKIKELKDAYFVVPSLDVVTKIDKLIADRKILENDYKASYTPKMLTEEQYQLYTQGKTACSMAMNTLRNNVSYIDKKLFHYVRLPILTTYEDSGSTYDTVFNSTDQSLYDSYTQFIDTNNDWKAELKGYVHTMNQVTGELSYRMEHSDQPTTHEFTENDDREFIKLIDDALKYATEIQRALNNYKKCLENELECYGRTRNSVGTLITVQAKKAPEYIMKILSMLQCITESYKEVLTHRMNHYFTIRLGW